MFQFNLDMLIESTAKQMVIAALLFIQNLIIGVEAPAVVKDPILDVLGETISEYDTYSSDISSVSKESKSEESGDSEFVTVIRVIDGDTIVLEDERKVRYIGVDAPETPDECYAEEASELNLALVLNKEVELRKEKTDKDLYGRMLRHVYVNGSNVSGELLRQGAVYAKSYKPDTSLDSEFEIYEGLAKKKSLGLWKACID